MSARHAASIGTAIAAPTLGTPTSIADAPSVEYELVTHYAAAAKLTVEALPTFPLDSTRKLRYAVAIDRLVLDLGERRNAYLGPPEIRIAE